MFTYLSPSTLLYRRGQLAPFFIVIIIIVIIATMVSVNIGKIAMTKTYTGNSSDAGALAAASVLAYAFNYIAFANSIMETNYKRFNHEARKHFLNAWAHLGLARHNATVAMGLACPFPCIAPGWVYEALAELDVFIREMYLLRDTIIPNYRSWQTHFYMLVRSRVHNDIPNSFDFYNVALEQGYKHNWMNSGIAVKKLRATAAQEEFYAFVDHIRWSNVKNCQEPEQDPNTLQQWADGRMRQHKVWSKVCIDPIRDYYIRHTIMNFQDEMETLSMALYYAHFAQQKLNEALVHLWTACPCKWCCIYEGTPLCCFCWAIECSFAVAKLTEAITAMDNASLVSYNAWVGLQIETNYTTKISSESEGDKGQIIGWIDDVGHTRLVETFSHQEHEPDANPENTARWQTEYQHIESSTLGTFNYNKRGHICSVHGNTCAPMWLHDAAILEADHAQDGG